MFSRVFGWCFLALLGAAVVIAEDGHSAGDGALQGIAQVARAHGELTGIQGEPSGAPAADGPNTDLFSATWLGTVGAGDDAAEKLAVSWRGEGEVDVTLFDDVDGDGRQSAVERVLLTRRFGPGVEVLAVPPGGDEANMMLSWAGADRDGLVGVNAASGTCGFDDGFFGDGLSGNVLSLVVFDDGGGGGPALYVGGDFTAAGNSTASRIAKWDGAAWSSLDGGMNGAVWDLAVFDDGGGGGSALYAGGFFSLAGGNPAVGVAKWDGTAWASLGGGALNSGVLTLEVFDDGGGGGPALYAGGFFTAVGGNPAGRIAKWDGTSWALLGSGLNSTVHSLAVFDDGSGAGPALYAGGEFTNAGGNTASKIAKWDGTAWSPLGPGPGFGINNSIRALVVFDDGGGGGPALYAGGDFNSIGAITANRIAKWDGATWATLGSGAANGLDHTVHSLAVFDDGGGSGPALYAGGSFGAAGGNSANQIAKWDGVAWSALGSGTQGLVVYSLAVFDDGGGPALFAGGNFTGADGSPANRIAKWDGALWSSLGSGSGNGVNYTVRSLATLDDGSGGGPALYAGGFFTDAGGNPANSIVRWDGAAWNALGSGLTSFGLAAVYSLTVFDDGGGSGPALYAGGAFTDAGGNPVNNIARWDGTAWSALGSGLNSNVWSLVVWDDGGGGGPALYAAGQFTFAGGNTANRIAKWDGTSWSTLGSGLNNTVYSLAVFDDGNGGGPALYAGGQFTTAGGSIANRVAKWDGTSWNTLGSGTDGTVLSLIVWDDGGGGGPALYAGGTFSLADGNSANRIAKWDGTAWSTLGSGMNNIVWTLVVFDDGGGAGPALYAGGRFTEAGGSPANSLAKWDGTAWNSLASGLNSDAYSLAVFDDGGGSGPALYAGGNFTAAGGAASWNFAKYSCTPPDTTPPTDPTSTSSPSHALSGWTSDSTIDMTWSGASDELDGSGLAGYSVLFDQLPTTQPDTTVDVTQSADPHSATSAVLADGMHYFHLSTCDVAGNCTNTVHAGPYGIDTSDPDAPSSFFISSSHGSGAPESEDQVEVSWDASSDSGSGVAAYYYDFTNSDVPPTCASMAGQSVATNAVTSDPLADGAWYLHVCAVDQAGNMSTVSSVGAFLIDTSGPTGLNLSSSSHAVSTWNHDRIVDIALNGASDPNGVAGYAVVLDQLPTTDPGTATTQTATSFSGIAAPDGNNWYVHARACDTVGNCGAVEHFGPLWVDGTVPSDPTSFAATSHAASVWSNDDTVDLEWSGAADALSGLAGYSIGYDLLSPDSPEAYVGQFGSMGSGTGQFNQPRDLSIDSLGNLYVADYLNGRIQKFDQGGNFLLEFGSFTSLLGVAVGPSGHIYAVDSSAEEVSKFTSEGVSVLSWGSEGTADGQFDTPRGIFVDASERVWVADSGNHRIQRFSSTGVHEVSFGSGPSAGSGLFSTPIDVAVDSGGNVYVADFNNDRVQKFDSGLNYLSQWGTVGSAPGMFLAPTGLEILKDGTVLVFDVGNDFVHRFDPNGVFLSAFGGVGSGDGEFSNPEHGAVFNGRIFVVDIFNHRVQFFDPITTPDATIDVAHTADPHTTTSAALPEGDMNYAHLRTCDVAGNCTRTVHAGPFWIDTTDPSAPGAVTSSSHAGGGPVSDATIDGAWGAATDALSGVASYRYDFTTSAVAPACAALTQTTASTSATSGALLDGTWHLHVCAVDNAGNQGTVSSGGPFVIDTAGPTGLNLTSSSHVVSTWNVDDTVDLALNDATDANGVTGYVVAFDQSPTTDPGSVATQASATYEGTATSDGNDWYAHARACDAAGNCGAVVHLGPFWIDATNPGAPGAVTSGSHDPGPAMDNTIDVAWTAAADATSGVASYRYDFSASAIAPACSALTGTTASTSATSATLADGAWYFHVCAIDNAGNEGDVTTGGAYDIDNGAPEVAGVEVSPSPVGGLVDGGLYRVGVSGFSVTFDELLDAASAETLGNYLLVTPGGDGSFDTTSCTVAGDDVAVAIDSASWNAGTQRVALGVNGAAELADGDYLLVVCATITDTAANALDGNGDGTGGDDFLTGFSIDQTPPQVSSVGSTADTGDGVLGEGEATAVAITELSLTFSELMRDPAGDSVASDITRPGNYQLIAANADDVLDTTDCSAVDANDTAISIETAVWTAATLTVNLSVNAGAALTDGLYGLFACPLASDLAGNKLDGNGDGSGGDAFLRTFRVDTVTPTDPTLAQSTSHALSGWTSDATIDMSWQGAMDEAGGSGLAGYSVLFDQLPTTQPDGTVDVAQSADPHGVSSTALLDGMWTFHLSTCDAAGNCTSTVHAGPYGVDTTPPSAPGAVTSSSHGAAPTSDGTIAGSWGAASDATSGVASYRYDFTASAVAPACAALTQTTAGTSAMSPALVDGTWHLHVCAVDNAGNPGAVSSSGPLVVDTTAPTGLTLSSSSHVLSTWNADGTVDIALDDATDTNGVTGYAVAFDQSPMTDPGGAATQAGATYEGTAASDGNDWYAHARACDAAGNCGDVVHLGPFWVDTTDPGAPGAVTSSSHGGGSPTSNDTISGSWGAATDATSGVVSYRYAFTASAVAPACHTLGETTASTSATSAALADGDWYLHVCAVDTAGNEGTVTSGGPFVVDTTAPTGLILSSTSHVVSTWIADLSVDVVLSGASDARGAAGIAGYAIAFDQSATTDPGAVITQAGTTYVGNATIDANDWYAHARACDVAGNCGDVVHFGPLWIDATPPEAPTGLDSSSHVVGETSGDDTIDTEWTAGSDATSGVAGYAWTFSTLDTWVCDGSESGIDGTDLGTTSNPQTSDVWFHVCTVDEAGNGSAVSSLGPFVLDLMPPLVTAVDTVADTGDGMLEDTETTSASLTQILVSLDEPLDEAAAEDLDSWQLIEEGGDAWFDSTPCDPVDAADVDHSPQTATLLGDGQTVRLDVGAGFALPEGNYRLSPCGATDEVGNVVGPSDLHFQIATTNAMPNPNFDATPTGPGNVSGWAVGGPSPAALVWSAEDVDDKATSGSLAIARTTARGAEEGSITTVTRCIPLPTEETRSLYGFVRVFAAGGTGPSVALSLAGSSAPDCSDVTTWPQSGLVAGGVTEGWQPFRGGGGPAAAGSTSFLGLRLTVKDGTAPDFIVEIDRLLLDDGLFSDGFESGDTSAWSDPKP